MSTIGSWASTHYRRRILEVHDGRKPVAWLPELVFEDGRDPVVQVVADKSGEVLYTLRVRGGRFQPPVFAAGEYTVSVGRDRPNQLLLKGSRADRRGAAQPIHVKLD